MIAHTAMNTYSHVGFTADSGHMAATQRTDALGQKATSSKD
jgi:hypothetical protein